MYHSITIVGNLGKDPEMKFTPAGQALTNFSVATTREYTTPQGEKVKETIWFRVSVWGKMAEVCNKYLQKGSKVLIEGRLTPDKATGNPRVYTKGDGTAAASFEVTASTVRFIGGTKSSDAQPEAVGEDDNPF